MLKMAALALADVEIKQYIWHQLVAQKYKYKNINFKCVSAPGILLWILPGIHVIENVHFGAMP